MNEINYLKVFTLVGFLAFAAVSCWATAESLHLLLPAFPLVLCWVVTVGFFFIASWGSKMIMDSLNQNIYQEKRTASFVVGIVLLLVFWLICSMPTNTHTFFYRNLIDQKVTTDIKTTQSYLAQIKDNTVTDAKIQKRITEFKNKVEIKMGELEAEIKNDANPGNGPKAKAILSEFATMLDVNKLEPISFVGTSVQDRQKLCDAYRQKIFLLRDTKIRNIISEMTPSNSNYRKIAEKDWKNLELTSKYIQDGSLNVNDADDIKDICGKLDEGYVTVKTFNQFVDFKNNEDKEAYTCPNPETKVKRLLSVYDVWVDFLTGKSGGLSFVFWIIISILVDIAAFIFFDIAFKKEM